MSAGRPAVFLDRDGVINRDAWPTVLSWSEFQLLPGVAQAIADLRGAGWPVFIVTNKTAVGWGLLARREHEAIMQRMLAALAAQGARIDAWYHCPHNTLRRCACHKPRPGMLLQATREHGLSLRESWIVGDTHRDVRAGKAAGCRTILVGGSRAGRRAGPDLEAADLRQAADLILAQTQASPAPSPAPQAC